MCYFKDLSAIADCSGDEVLYVSYSLCSFLIGTKKSPVVLCITSGNSWNLEEKVNYDGFRDAGHRSTFKELSATIKNSEVSEEEFTAIISRISEFTAQLEGVGFFRHIHALEDYPPDEVAFLVYGDTRFMVGAKNSTRLLNLSCEPLKTSEVEDNGKYWRDRGRRTTLLELKIAINSSKASEDVKDSVRQTLYAFINELEPKIGEDMEKETEQKETQSQGFKAHVGKLMDCVVEWSKRPFAFLDWAQQKLMRMSEATGLSWVFRKLAQLGRLLAKKEFVAVLLGVSALKLVRVRKALRTLITWLKKKVGELPIAKPLVNLLSRVLDAILWVDDKAFEAVEAVGAWIITHILKLVNPIYSFLAGDDEEEACEEASEGRKVEPDVHKSNDWEVTTETP